MKELSLYNLLSTIWKSWIYIQNYGVWHNKKEPHFLWLKDFHPIKHKNKIVFLDFWSNFNALFLNMHF